MSIGENIKHLRESHGMSQTELGQIAGVSDKAVSTWENGLKIPRMGAVQRLADYFGILKSQILDDAPSTLPSDAQPINFSKYHRIPILGRIPAGLPLYAEQNIEGYTLTDLNGGAEYFALRVSGDSMNAIGINDGYIITVRKQEAVENGEIAVILVGDEDATVKRFYSTETTVTLMPQSTNPVHQPQVYDLAKTNIQILGKVVKVEFSI